MVCILNYLLFNMLCVANPQAARNDAVCEALYHRNPPMPEQYMEEILDESGSYSPLDELIGNTAADLHLVRTLGDEIIRKYLADTVHQIRRHYLLDTSDVDNNALLLSLGQQLIDVSSGWDRALFLFETSGIDSAIAALQKVENDFMLTDAENIIQQEYYDLMAISQWCTEHTDSLFLVDPQWLNYLGEMAASKHHFSAAMAISLLENLNPGYLNVEEILLPSYSALRRLPAVANETFELTLFPNPAKTHITITYHTDVPNGIIQISDATGKVVIERSLSGKQGDLLMDIQNLESGLYLVQLRQNNVILVSERLMITH